MIVVTSSWNSLTTWHPAKAGALTAAASFVALAAILYRQLSSSNKAQEDSIPSPEGSLPFIGNTYILSTCNPYQCMFTHFISSYRSSLEATQRCCQEMSSMAR